MDRTGDAGGVGERTVFFEVKIDFREYMHFYCLFGHNYAIIVLKKGVKCYAAYYAH